MTPRLKNARRWLLAGSLALLLMLPLAAPAMADGGTGTSGTPAAGATDGKTAAAAAIPAVATQLKVDLVQGKNQTAQATATLTDATGKAVTKADVVFIRKTTFGKLTLDTVTTDFMGQATVSLPTHPGQQIIVTAQYAGGPGFAPAESQATLTLPPNPPAPVHLGFYSQLPNPWFVFGIVVVIGGIWFTYGIAFNTVRKIRRAGESTAASEAAATAHD